MQNYWNNLNQVLNGQLNWINTTQKLPEILPFPGRIKGL